MNVQIVSFLLVVALMLAGCGVSQTERWDAEDQRIETPLGPENVETNIEDGQLQISISQKVEIKATPIERMTIVYDETYSDIDWDEVGMVTFAVIGGMLVVAGTIVGGIYVGG